MEPHGEGPRRKRKSRFSDAPAAAAAPIAKRHAVGSGAAPAVDPAALARAAAAKISCAIPGSAAAAAFPVPAAAPGATAARIDSEELRRIEEEKKRRTDQIYKSVQSQMSHIKALLRKPGAPVAAAAATHSAHAVGHSTFMPAPLLLDEQGREIDAAGKVVAEKPTVAPVATLKANQGAARGGEAAKKKNQNPYLSHHTVDEEDKLEAVDPRLKVTKRETRARKTFNFVAQGTYVKQAEQVRARDAKKMMAGFTSGRNPRGYQKESIAPITESAEPDNETSSKMEVDSVEVPPKPEMSTPDVEWWDVGYLPKDKRAIVDKFGFIKAKARREDPEERVSYSDMKLKYCGTAHVIEHPVRLNLIVKDDGKPVAVPLMLTAAERKKIRRQNRADREKEKQDKIALGLLPPPEPKVKLSNMMRVLSEQAVADPSAIERKVREQIAQREKNHEMRNLARKLTPEERREKKLRKIKEDAAGDIHVALFKYVLCALCIVTFHDRSTDSAQFLLLKRVPDLSNPQHRFKVDVNAQQYHLTGGVLLCKDSNINMVVVEGGKKAIKQYSKLMTRRIDWNGVREAEQESDSEDDDAAKRGNGCLLVWQGVVARKAFNNFRFQECRTSATARKVMEAKNVVHYWDLVEKSAETAAP
ncbi:U4/U6-U5 snRNP complex subunit prp3 [Phytophthora pseudosyringae]|uniref:U4/U6-U5 snRNP complex subunit prp3 n=1 Tax=Phytophthora pseudosyringae TaxID=221518 RepID=A0A8T1WCV4_9STRA|nr:U4/U6-U5 snRNP complex subunit prp3 [Phytophthora pseudosyringae]